MSLWFIAFVLWSVAFSSPLGMAVTANSVLLGEQAIEVSFSIREPTVSLHEPVFMLLTAHNGANRKTNLYLGKNNVANFRFVITDPKGRTHQIPPLRPGGMGTTGRVSLGPDETYQHRLVLNQWYPFSEIGRYVIEAKLVESLPTEPEKMLHAWSSQKMSVTVEPRDTMRLAKVCKHLLDSILSDPRSDTASAAALGLSYVDDPVALPYLNRLLGAGSVLSWAAARGLVRIGTPQAVQVLMSHRKSPDPVVRLQVEQALTEIRTGIHPNVAD